MKAPTYADLLNYHTLLSAFFKVKANKGIAGSDNITITHFENNLELGLLLLLDELKSNSFTASPFHRIVMKQKGKKSRTLMIPTVKDRIVHTALSMILQPYFEPEFERCSFGYRPNRSYKMAIGQIIKYRDEGNQWLLDADINQFFDNIPHHHLLKIFNKYIKCEDITKLVITCLFENQLVDNDIYFGNAKGVGIPQGSSLSPLLSNLYLDELDESLLKKNFKLVRYADDFVVLTNTQEQALQALNETEKILYQLELTLNTEKTHITHFNDGFSFLGHTFINDLVLDNKSQVPYQSKESIMIEDTEDTQLALLSSSSVEEVNSPDIPDNEANVSHLASTIFDQDEWEKTEKQTNYQELGVILNTRIRSLYVTTQGTVLSKKGNRLLVSQNSKLLKSIPLSTLDGVVLFGRVHLTTDIMVYCLSHNMPVIFSSRAGVFHGILDNYNSYNETLLRQQMTHTKSLGKQLTISRQILESKFNNSLVILKRIIRKRKQSTEQEESIKVFSEDVRRYKNKIKKENSLATILGFEGVVAKQYFSIFRSVFDPSWQFTHRNRRPPKDPINVMLSLGYTILFNNIYTLLKVQKLNPSFGYLHHGADEQPSLVLDLMEQFRAPIVDATIYKLINNHKITLQNFSITDNACNMNKEGFIIFLNAIEHKLQSQISHPSTKDICDYRRIIDIQIAEIKVSIKNDSDTYKAFLIR